MYIPSDPKIWREISHDSFIQKRTLWILIICAYMFPYAIKDFVPELVIVTDYMIHIISFLMPEVYKWIDRSSNSEATTILHIYLWFIFIPYLRYLLTKHKAYENGFVLTELDSWRRFMKPLAIILFMSISLVLYKFVLPEMPNCNLLCIHGSIRVHTTFMLCITSALAYSFAMIYWWFKNIKLIFAGQE